MRHPIWQIVREQGRNLTWLARRTGYKHGYVKLIACGAHRASPAFRKAAAHAMELPEELLFITNERNGESQSPRKVA